MCHKIMCLCHAKIQDFSGVSVMQTQIPYLHEFIYLRKLYEYFIPGMTVCNALNRYALIACSLFAIL